MISINATVILTILNFILLIAVLKTILWKPMMTFLEDRAKKIEESLNLAEKNKKRAKELEIEHDEIIKEARTKASDILDKATVTASEESRKIIAQAKEHSGNLAEATKKEILMEAEQIKQNLRKEVAAMSVTLAGKVLEREVREQDHQDIIKRNLDALGV